MSPTTSTLWVKASRRILRQNRWADDMRRMQNLSRRTWNATGGLLTLLGASAPFTFALSLIIPKRSD